jgi:hypothetical protein
MADSAVKQIFIGIVATAVGGLIVWWVTSVVYHPEKGATDQSSLIQSHSSGAQGPAAETADPARTNPPHAQGIWLGFANEAGSLERETELRARCGDFRRVYVPLGAGNMFSDLCDQEDKTCERVCDWEGRIFPCSAISQGGRRDGSRVALCR